MSCTEIRPPFVPTAKSRRCYHRVISGCQRGGRLRFLTLTSSNESPDTCQRSWRMLYMRLKRRGLIEGYIKVPEQSKNGKQHLHVLFRGSYLQQAWVSQLWQEIHHAKIIDIRPVKQNRDRRGLASYMAKYMSKENLYRYSWNWGWVWRGFCKDWLELKRRARCLVVDGKEITFRQIIVFWGGCLRAGSSRPIYDLPPPLKMY